MCKLARRVFLVNGQTTRPRVTAITDYCDNVGRGHWCQPWIPLYKNYKRGYAKPNAAFSETGHKYKTVATLNTSLKDCC